MARGFTQRAFDGGDIDRPLVVGSHYNGADPPPFAAGQDSAANHPGVLSGWHSHNHQDGFNQWVVDDAPAQLRTRLTAHPLRSELGLGHLIHHSPGSAQRGAWGARPYIRPAIISAPGSTLM